MEYCKICGNLIAQETIVVTIKFNNINKLKLSYAVCTACKAGLKGLSFENILLKLFHKDDKIVPP